MTYSLALLGALAGAITVFVYTAMDIFTVRHLRELSLDDVLNRQIMFALKRNKRSTAFASKLERMLTGSSIRLFGEPLSVSQFFLFSAALALVFFVLAVLILKNSVAGLILGGLGAILPYQILEVSYNRTRQALSKQGANFLLAVSNLYGVYGDPLVALEHCVRQLKDPLRREVRNFVTMTRAGMPLAECVEIVKSRTPDAVLRQFWDDTRFFLERGGNYQEAIAEHVDDLYEREINSVERSAQIGSTLTVFFAISGVYFMILGTLRQNNPELISFLTDTTAGKAAVVLMISIFIAAGYFVKLMTTEKDSS